MIRNSQNGTKKWNLQNGNTRETKKNGSKSETHKMVPQEKLINWWHKKNEQIIGSFSILRYVCGGGGGVWIATPVNLGVLRESAQFI